jgi:hypothetical protein
MPEGTIFPTPEAGGVDGYAQPPLAEKVHVPAPAFEISPCDYLALPSDCTARIESKQLNAIVSEMIALAECWNPTGPWDCGVLTNLCAAFIAGGFGATVVDQISIVGQGNTADPLSVYLVDCGTY